MKITLSSPGLHHLMWLYPDERTREKRAGECAPVSKSELSRIPCGAQWEPSRKASLPLPHLQDVLWGNARDAHVWVEDLCRGGGPSAVDRDATGQLAWGRRDHGPQIRDHQPVAETGSDPCRGPDAGAGQRSASEPGGN